MNVEKKTITVTKLDAARRQLQTAITLWFDEGDPVSIHTLAHAAYEVIHFVSEKRDRFRRDLLFDTFVIKDEYRGEFIKLVKRPGNFFKHADRDADQTLEFKPELSEVLILFSILGLNLCGEPANNEEAAFMFWLYFHRPTLLTEAGRKRFVEEVPVVHLLDLRSIPKNKFLQVMKAARRKDLRSAARARPAIE